jgi:hypothetical protein
MIEKIFPKLVNEEIANGSEPKQVLETFETYKRLVQLNSNYNPNLLEEVKTKVDYYLIEKNLNKNSGIKFSLRKPHYSLGELK